MAKHRACAKCGNKRAAGALFCSHCGQQFLARCPYCPDIHPISDIYCHRTGGNLEEVAAARACQSQFYAVMGPIGLLRTMGLVAALMLVFSSACLLAIGVALFVKYTIENWKVVLPIALPSVAAVALSKRQQRLLQDRIVYRYAFRPTQQKLGLPESPDVMDNGEAYFLAHHRRENPERLLIGTSK